MKRLRFNSDAEGILNNGQKRSKVLILALVALPFAAPIVNAQTPERTIILADTVKLTRWADIHQVPDPAHNDPYYHLEVFEHKKGAKPGVQTARSPYGHYARRTR
ncbi:DUF5086 family protein [Ochrobactrum pseudogrignonense]|nr:DUF5086 family protein [Brucella pseudogrignonensis]